MTKEKEIMQDLKNCQLLHHQAGIGLNNQTKLLQLKTRDNAVTAMLSLLPEL
jgi:hypothetical protein